MLMGISMLFYPGYIRGIN